MCAIIAFLSIFAPIVGAGMIYLPFELGVLIPTIIGIITPTSLWLIFRKKYKFLDRFGKSITNWIVTNLLIYSVCILMLSFDFIVFKVIFGIILVFGSLLNLFVGFATFEELLKEADIFFLEKFTFRFLK